MKLNQDYHKTTTALVLEKRVDQFTAIMRSWLAARPNQPISHLVYRGVSGACMAWPLSYRLRIPVIAIRKPGETSHSYDGDNIGAISGDGDLCGYVIVDDFICSGNTIQRIIDRIDLEWKKRDIMGERPYCEGILLHDSDQGGSFRDFFCVDERMIPVIHCKTAA